ncbi:hypothetical protein [Nocardia spumae]|uniref:hypothetical protein n=1 Tax=Nocardia spumae TaxID=2887190 RepID=UPI001D15C381|nr:hypothetical protein [Nocardia spumae]
MIHRRNILNPGAREVLDYFGKCPECGYPATASADFAEATTVVARCDRPCGWTGAVPLTTMTARPS